MKNQSKLLLFFILVSHVGSAFAREKYIETPEETIIYRAEEKAALVIGLGVGIAVGAITTLPLLLLQVGINEQDFKGRFLSIGIMAAPLAPIGWGSYRYLRSWYLRDEPIMKMNARGLTYEDSFYSWEEIDAPVIVENISGMRVSTREIWFPFIHKKEQYVKIDLCSIGVDREKLLHFISRYTSINVPSLEELHDYIPLALQKKVTPEIREKIDTMAYDGFCTVVINCIKKVPHQCATHNAQIQ